MEVGRMAASRLPELRTPFGAALDCGSYPTLRKFARVRSGSRIRDFRAYSFGEQASEKCFMPESPAESRQPLLTARENNHENPHLTYRGFSKLPRE